MANPTTVPYQRTGGENFEPFELEVERVGKITYSGEGRLGTGHSSVVLPGTLTLSNSENVEVAIKIIRTKNRRSAEVLSGECDLLLKKEVREHANIITYYGSLLSEGDNSTYTVLVLTERMKCSLSSFLFDEGQREGEEPAAPEFPKLRKLTFRSLIEVFRQVAVGLEHLHAHQIIHLDIKPENIFISQDLASVKIADFGLSKVCKDERESMSATFRGTLKYMAPEVFLGQFQVPVAKDPTVTIGKEVDIFSFGCLMWECMNMRKMGKSVDHMGCETTAQKIEWGTARGKQEAWCRGPPELCNLVETCLRFNKDALKENKRDHGRPAASVVRGCLEDMLKEPYEWLDTQLPEYTVGWREAIV